MVTSGSESQLMEGNGVQKQAAFDHAQIPGDRTNILISDRMPSWLTGSPSHVKIYILTTRSSAVTMAFPSGLLALAFTTIASATSTTIQTTFSATLAASGDLASYGSDMSSITFGPPSWATSTTELTTAATSATTSLTWCSEASCVQWPAPYGDVTTRNYGMLSIALSLSLSLYHMQPGL